MTDWVNDIKKLRHKHGVDVITKQLDSDKLKEFLLFRQRFMQEEVDELKAAIEDQDGDDVVDAFIDLCVVAIDTLEAFDVDSNKAWKEVLRANSTKVVGIKESRPNPFGLPDLIKLEDWVKPNHKDNVGKLKEIF